MPLQTLPVERPWARGLNLTKSGIYIYQQEYIPAVVSLTKVVQIHALPPEDLERLYDDAPTSSMDIYT